MSQTDSTFSKGRLLTAYFESRPEAQKAVDRLKEIGIPTEQVRLTEGSATGTDKSKAKTGFWASLQDLFLPEDDRDAYAEGLSRGGFVVAARVAETSYNDALDILDAEGTVDIDERQEAWRSEGWTDTRGAVSSTEDSAETSSIPIAEESVRIGKRDVKNGRVRVRSYVVEEPVNASVTLRDEKVDVERRAVDRAATPGDDLFKERTIELEEHSEEAVVAKDVRVTEELVVKKDISERTEQVSDTVRKTRVEVEDERGNKVDPIKRKT